MRLERPDWYNDAFKQPDPDKERGTHYADGGAEWAPVIYPDPERIRQINEEWENQNGDQR